MLLSTNKNPGQKIEVQETLYSQMAQQIQVDTENGLNKILNFH